MFLATLFRPNTEIPPALDPQSPSRDGRPYRWFACYSSRGAPGYVHPLLRPVITPSMGVVPVITTFAVPAKSQLTIAERELQVLYQIHAVGYNSSLESISTYVARFLPKLAGFFKERVLGPAEE